MSLIGLTLYIDNWFWLCQVCKKTHCQTSDQMTAPVPATWDGTMPWSQTYSGNLIRSGTFNQCACYVVSGAMELIRSERLAEKTERAAAFNANCSRFCSWRETPARIEFQFCSSHSFNFSKTFSKMRVGRKDFYHHLQTTTSDMHRAMRVDSDTLNILLR